MSHGLEGPSAGDRVARPGSAGLGEMVRGSTQARGLILAGAKGDWLL